VESPCISSCPADGVASLLIPSIPHRQQVLPRASRSISKYLSSLIKSPSPYQCTPLSSRHHIHAAIRTPLTAQLTQMLEMQSLQSIMHLVHEFCGSPCTAARLYRCRTSRSLLDSSSRDKRTPRGRNVLCWN
jgi:hypothetical protein